MPGPAPKPDSERRRRNATPPTVVLPAEGRKGTPPAWPIGKPRKADTELWDQLWTKPQAVAWERLGMLETVATYCRLKVDSWKPNAKVTLHGECRQLEDRLGLNPMSMLRLRWEIAADELADARAVTDAPAKRRRLQAVDPALIGRRKKA